MKRIIITLLIVTGLLAAAAPAGAQGTSSGTPPTAGKASKLHFEVDGLAPPIDGRLPSALQLIAPGFKMNLQAVAHRCSTDSAKLNECPATSLLGRGALQVGVTAPDGNRNVTVPLNVYLHSPTRILAVAYVFGWRVVPGTLNTAKGITIGFDPLPQGPPFPDVSYTLQRISFDFGATRIVKTRIARRVKAKRRTARTRRLSLITNPSKCAGSWPSSINLRFPDGSTLPMATPTSCSTS